MYIRKGPPIVSYICNSLFAHAFCRLHELAELHCFESLEWTPITCGDFPFLYNSSLAHISPYDNHALMFLTEGQSCQTIFSFWAIVEQSHEVVQYHENSTSLVTITPSFICILVLFILVNWSHVKVFWFQDGITKVIWLGSNILLYPIFASLIKDMAMHIMKTIIHYIWSCNHHQH